MSTPRASSPQRHHIVLMDTKPDGYRVVSSAGLLDRPVVSRASFEQWLAALRERGWSVVSDANQLDPAGRIVVVERPKPAR